MSCHCGPGYKTPSEAIKSPRENLLYTTLVNCGENQPDSLATIDSDPNSATYSQVINVLKLPYNNDELHHFGWNTCSSCFGDASKSRRFLILLGQKSSRVYVIDTQDAKAPTIYKIIEPDEIKEKSNLSAPHTVHCLADGNLMISMLGDKNGEAPGK